jgi:hypothetical protein
MIHHRQKGAALILVMIMLAVLAVMTVSMMFLSQSESWATMNYRLMSQARDGAEAAVYRAANFIAGSNTGGGALQPDGFTYKPPDGGSFTAFANNGTTSPVTMAGSGTPVGLYTSNMSSHPTLDYPTATGFTAGVQTHFDSTNGAQGTLTAGTAATGITKINYGAYAELLSIKSIGASSLLCGGGGINTIERWKITGEGGIAGVQGATVQVSAIIDKPIVSCAPTAAYATSNTCDPAHPPLWFNGGGLTSSYDSTISGCDSTTIGTTFGAGGCGLDDSGGSVGTNGYGDIGNSATINGSVYVPRTGAPGGGDCDPATTGGGDITGDPQVVEEAQVPDYPPPELPTPTPTAGANTFQQPSDCTAHPLQCSRRTLGGGAYLPGNTGTNSDTQFLMIPTCSPAVIQCSTGTTAYQDLQVKGSNTYHFCPGTYSVNSIAMGAGATIKIHQPTDPGPPYYATYCGTDPAGPVYINVLGAGHNISQPVIDFSSGSLSNPSMSASNFQLLYSGSDAAWPDVNCFATGSTTAPCGSIKLSGGPASAALVYAPLADVTLGGSATYYGAMIGYTVKTTGSASISYDRSLSDSAIQPGNAMFQSFTWKKF